MVSELVAISRLRSKFSPLAPAGARLVQNSPVQLQGCAQSCGKTGLLSVSCQLAERCVIVSVAPMRPAITACNPSRCVVHCKASPITHPQKRHKFLSHQITASRPQLQRLYAVPEDKKSTEEDEDFEGLLPEEDWTVPGGYQDSLSSNTELGRAVQSACDELDNLSNLEKESLTKASELLQKLGYKGSIFQDAPASSESDGSKKDDA